MGPSGWTGASRNGTPTLLLPPSLLSSDVPFLTGETLFGGVLSAPTAKRKRTVGANKYLVETLSEYLPAQVSLDPIHRCRVSHIETLGVTLM
jgi:hypothetical protein